VSVMFGHADNFQGLLPLPLGEDIDSYCLAIPHRPKVSRLYGYLHATSLSPHMPMNEGNDLIVLFEKSLWFHSSVVKSLEVAFDELPYTSVTAIDTRVDAPFRQMPLDVGVEALKGMLEVASIPSLVDSPNDCHVLLRHHPQYRVFRPGQECAAFISRGRCSLSRNATVSV
jgi:hypothetical protein